MGDAAKSLSRLVAGFRVPDAETRARMDAAYRRAQAEERERAARERISRSRIPELYRSARLSECDPAIAAWVQARRAGSRRNLVIQGKVGRGKTYAACAALIALAPEEGVLFANFEDVLEEIRQSFGGRGGDVVARYSAAPVLCLDDFGKSRPTEWTMPLMWRLVDRRSANGRPTVYTTQYGGAELRERLRVPGDDATAAAILSRMKDSDVVRIEGPDRRGGLR